jgi:hypothetical protein
MPNARTSLSGIITCCLQAEKGRVQKQYGRRWTAQQSTGQSAETGALASCTDHHLDLGATTDDVV